MITSTENWLTAQVAVLGSMMLAPQKCVRTIIASSRPEDYSDTYRPVFSAIRGLYGEGRPVDPVTVNGRLGGGSRDLLFGIMDQTPTAENWAEYLALMLEQSRCIRIQELGLRLSEVGTWPDQELILAELDKFRAPPTKTHSYTMRELCEDFLERQSSPKQYLTWGIQPLNERLYIDYGDFVLIGGYPSDGKTALALTMAFHQAERTKVGFFSFETNEKKIFDRLAAMTSKINFGRIKRRSMSEDDFDAFAVVCPRIAEHNLEVIPAAGWTVDQIRDETKRRGFRVIYIDYVQLVAGKGKVDNETARVSQVSRDLHEMSQADQVTVVGLSQLSRDKENFGRRPRLHQLKNTSQLEQDADAILFIWRKNDDERDYKRQLDIAKNKEGELLETCLAFDGATQTFRYDANEVFRQKQERERKRQERARKKQEQQQQAQDGQLALVELPDDESVPF